MITLIKNAPIQAITMHIYHFNIILILLDLQ